MPSLDEIRSTIQRSTAVDWEVLLAGPTYLDAFAMVSGPQPWHVEHEEHTERAVYRPDVALGLAWGLPAMSRDTALRFAWSEQFPDSTVYLDFVDVLWNGMLVDRRQVAVIDGGRGTLPQARPLVVETGQTWPEVVGETATVYDVHVARLVHQLRGAHHGDFEDYLGRAGIVETP